MRVMIDNKDNTKTAGFRDAGPSRGKRPCGGLASKRQRKSGVWLVSILRFFMVRRIFLAARYLFYTVKK